MRLTVLETRLTVCRLPADSAIPAWVDDAGEFVSITRTPDELSIVGASDAVPAGLPAEGPWRAFKVQGPLVMTLIGVVAAIADPLRDAGVAIFAISSYDTDYVLVHEPDFEAAVSALDRRWPRGHLEPRIAAPRPRWVSRWRRAIESDSGSVAGACVLAVRQRWRPAIDSFLGVAGSTPAIGRRRSHWC